MNFINQLDTYIKIQNVQLIKLICYNENWDYVDTIKLLKDIYKS